MDRLQHRQHLDLTYDDCERCHLSLDECPILLNDHYRDNHNPDFVDGWYFEDSDNKDLHGPFSTLSQCLDFYKKYEEVHKQ